METLTKEGLMSFVLGLLMAVSLSGAPTSDVVSHQKKLLDRPTYSKPIYAPGVKTNVKVGKQLWNTLISEDFESGMPAEWTVVNNNGDGYMWTTGTTSDLLGYDPPNYGTAYAYYSDDDAGSSAPAGNEELQTPTFGIATYDSLVLIYGVGFNILGSPTGQVWARFFTGGSWGTWDTLVTYLSDTSFVDTLDLSSFLPADSVQIDFVYFEQSATWAWAYAIDNVELNAHLGGGGMYDIGVTGLDSPPSLMMLDSVYNVISTFFNFGDSAFTFGVHTEITDTLGSTVYFTYDSTNISLLPDSSIQINFGTWTMTTQGKYIYKTYTTTPDSFPSNDTLQKILTTSIDVGVSAITSPPEGPVTSGNYDVKGTIHNYGVNPETFNATAIVYDTTDAWNVIFNQTVALTDFAPGADTTINFGTVTFADDKVFFTKVYTDLVDDDPGNDTLSIYSRTALGMGDVIFEMDAQTITGDNQLLGIEFDGTYFYITSGGNGSDPNKVYVIDTLGTLKWTLDQPAHSTGWGWRDLTWDGTYAGSDRIDTLYASVNDSVDKFGIDLTNGILNLYGAFPGPESPNRALAYKGDSAWFYTANFSSNCYKFSKTNPNIQSVANSYAIYGAAYDTDTAGGEWVWWHSQDDPGTGFDLQIEQMDPITMNFTGVTFGYVPPSLTGGMAGGLCFYQGFRGADVLFALVQGDPVDEIVGVYLRKASPSGIDVHNDEITPYLSIPMKVGVGEIRFTYKGGKPSDVIVRDIMGRSVKEYTNVKSGSVLRFGSNAASGIYFISVKGSSKINKVTLIK